MKPFKFSDEQNDSIIKSRFNFRCGKNYHKRLGRTTTHRKWFYVQPIFTYPSKEEYQIGCEWIDHNNIADIINLTANILTSFKK